MADGDERDRWVRALASCWFGVVVLGVDGVGVWVVLGMLLSYWGLCGRVDLVTIKTRRELTSSTNSEQQRLG